MKRDMDLIRQLLLQLESLETRRGGIYHFPLDDNEPDEDLNLPGYSSHQVEYHAKLITDAGLIDPGGSGVMNGFTFRGLTWQGHDFVDSIRDDAIWSKTKKGASEVGSFSFDLIRDLAKGFIKKQIQDKTGIVL